MAGASTSYGMTRSELSSFLAEQRENGFLDLDQTKRAFGLAFVQTGSYTEAAAEAGIEHPTARRWLRDPLVSAFVLYLNQCKEHYSLIDASFIESQYLILLSKLLGEEEVYLVGKEDTQIKRRKFHASEAVSCIRDLAKVSGHYKEEGASVNIHVTSLTDEQRRLLNEKLDNAF